MQSKQIRIKDIAERAGVSTGTVDRVLHQRGEVSPDTRDRVLAIAKEMRYQPNFIARTLASRKAYRFGVLIPAGSGNNPYWKAPLAGVLRAQEELAPYGIEIDIRSFQSTDVKDFLQKGEEIIAAAPDGILLAPVFFSASTRFLKSCANSKIPVVFIDSSLPYDHALRYIGQNSCQAGFVAARLLSMGQAINSNYLVFSIVQEKDQLHHLTDRENGFRSFFTQRNESPTILSITVENDFIQNIKTSIRKVYSELGSIEGIFVTGSKVYQVAQAIEELNLPKIRLLGFDLVKANIDYLNKEMIDFLISQQPEDQGYQGIQSLYSILVQKNSLPSVKHTAIDIITSENLKSYVSCR